MRVMIGRIEIGIIADARPAVSSPHPFAHETIFPQSQRHRAVLVYPPRAGAEESRASFATPDDRAQEMNSANPQRIPFGSEIPAIGNDRASSNAERSRIKSPIATPTRGFPCRGWKTPNGRFSNGKCESGETSMKDLRGINGRDGALRRPDAAARRPYPTANPTRANRHAAHRSCNCRKTSRICAGIAGVPYRFSSRATQRNRR